MKRPLEVGDRVRVKRGGRFPFTGTISHVAPSSGKDLKGNYREAGIFVIEDGCLSNHDESPFHPRQCVRLKPKPTSEKREARWVWVQPACEENAWEIQATHSDPDDPTYIVYREVLPGEVPITKEKLAGAMAGLAKYFEGEAEMDCFEGDLAKALGLEAK